MSFARDIAPYALTIELDDPDDLFNARAADVMHGVPSREPGIDEILNEMGSRSAAATSTVVIVLPRERATPEAERGMRHALRRYCDVGITRAENELKAIQREGMQALLLGVVMLAAFLALSEIVLKSSIPGGLRNFFGNGLFLVAAWVGMWYPLDTLIYTGRPHRIERKLLHALRDAKIVVQSEAEGGSSTADVPERVAQS